VPQYSRRVARGTAQSQLDSAELSAVIPGRAIAENGGPDRGIALAMQALAAMRAIQSRHFLCYLLGLPAGPFVCSPEVILPHFLFIVPPAECFVANKNSN
jgi:uncharacterized protein (UPF0261 family)